MPVCETCNDTHTMELRGQVVMCTHCPVPCQSCRSGGNGPYCETTPCPCDCHKRGAVPTSPPSELRATVARAMFTAYREERARAGDRNCITYDQMAIERPVLHRAWLAAAAAAIGFAGGLIMKLVELGPRPERQYSEPTDEELKRLEDWDRQYCAVIAKFRVLGLLDEPVAKE